MIHILNMSQSMLVQRFLVLYSWYSLKHISAFGFDSTSTESLNVQYYELSYFRLFSYLLSHHIRLDIVTKYFQTLGWCKCRNVYFNFQHISFQLITFWLTSHYVCTVCEEISMSLMYYGTEVWSNLKLNFSSNMQVIILL